MWILYNLYLINVTIKITIYLKPFKMNLMFYGNKQTLRLIKNI